MAQPQPLGQDIEEFSANDTLGLGASSTIGQGSAIVRFAQERGLSRLILLNEVGSADSRLKVLAAPEGFLIALETPLKTYCTIVPDVSSAGRLAMELSFLTNRIGNVKTR